MLRIALAEPRLRENNIVEITDYVAPGLSGSRQDDVARDYQIINSSSAARVHRRAARDGLPVAVERGLCPVSLGHLMTQDNFGRLRAMLYARIETITTWLRGLFLLRDELVRFAALGKRWLEMKETGIEDAAALLPRPYDHAIQRVTVVEYLRALDEMAVPEDVSRLAAPNLSRAQSRKAGSAVRDSLPEARCR